MTLPEKAAILVSWCVTTAVGECLAYQKWSRGGSLRNALGAGLAIFLIMTWVHWIGYHVYQRQRAQERLFSLAWTHKRALRTALLQQTFVVVLAALTVDGGLLFEEARIAVLAYWMAWSIIAFARPAAPTTWDVRYIRTGYLIIFGLVIIAGPWVWWRLGYWPYGGEPMAHELELGGFLLAIGIIGFASRTPSKPVPKVGDDRCRMATSSS